MVVIRLIGDEWKFNEKIALAIPPSKSFTMMTTQLREKLQIPSFQGCALYFTEGKPPNYIRATVPVPMQSTPGREGLKDGSLLFVKTRCDGAQQQRDRVFQSALDDWRKANGIREILSDGSDVMDFLDDFVKRLNPSAAADINDHEHEERCKVEGLESREYFVVTFEFREVQQLKDKEKAQRLSLEESYDLEARRLYQVHVFLPRLQSERNAVARLEQQGRSIVAAESEKWFSNERAAWSQQTAQLVAAATARTNLQPLPSGNDHAPSTTAQTLISSDLHKELADMKRMMRSLLENQNETKRALTQAYESANDATALRYKSFMEAVLRTSQDLAERDVTIPLHAEEERLLRERRALLESLIEAEERDAENAQLALLQHQYQCLIEEGHRAEKDMLLLRDAARKNAHERNQLASTLRMVTEDCLRQQVEMKLLEDVASFQEKELLDVRKRLQVADLKSSAAPLLSGGDVTWDMSSNGRFERAMKRFPGTSGLHPDAFAVCLRVVEMYEPLPNTIHRTVLGHLPGTTGRVVDPMHPVDRLEHDEMAVKQSPEAQHFFRSLLVDISTKCAADPCHVQDELCFRYRIASHSLRPKFLRVLDDVEPFLAPVCDLLLHIYNEREAELMVVLKDVPSDDAVAYHDPATGSVYYYFAAVDMAQWRKPSKLADGVLLGGRVLMR